MGSHYVPQHYLRQFGTPEQAGMIWAYAKAGGPAKLLPIAAVAQAKGFYDPDDEAALNDQIEAPALASLTKLRRRELLDRDERARCECYRRCSFGRLWKQWGFSHLTVVAGGPPE